MDAAQARRLATSELQLTLLGEAIASADVGFLVWDEDRNYIAANARACDLLGCSLETLLGSVVGGQTPGGDETIDDVVREAGGRGKVTVQRFDGGQIELEYVTFTTRTSHLPFMASVIWPATAGEA
jgi:PAS domain-containing protein